MARQKTGAKKSWKYLQLSREIKTIYNTLKTKWFSSFSFLISKEQVKHVKYTHNIIIHICLQLAYLFTIHKILKEIKIQRKNESVSLEMISVKQLLNKPHLCVMYFLQSWYHKIDRFNSMDFRDYTIARKNMDQLSHKFLTPVAISSRICLLEF